MSLSLIGTATGTTTCTVPAHEVGDLIVIYAFRAGSTTAPGLGSGYLSQLTRSGTTCAGRVGWKIATSTSDSSGTWTNASQIVCHVYRASDFASGGSVRVGASASSASTNNTVNYPALTLVHSDGTSWVAGFAGVNNVTETVNTAPSGMTNESSAVGSSTSIAGHDTNGAVSSWSSTNATTTGTAGDSVSCALEIQWNTAGVASVANIVQHYSSAYNGSVAVNEPGNNYKFTLPNAVGAGNAIVLAIAYPSGTAPNSITDDGGNTWSTTAAVTADPGAGNTALKVYVLASAAAGTQAITVGFASSVQPCKAWITELYGITATVNGTAEASNVNSVNVISPGSFTPTNNNANGGNLVLAYMCSVNNSGTTNPFRICAATGYSLNDADISWNTGAGMPNASQFYLQATAAPTVPSFDLANGGTADTYNVAALALSVGTQGTAKPSGIHIDRVLYFSTNSNASTQTFQIPATGNCGVTAGFSSTTAPPTITSAADSDGNTWSKESVNAGDPTFLLGANLAQNPGRTLTVVFGTAANNLQLVYFDISGAAASPLAVVAGNNAAANSITTIAHQPDITPLQANGLVIAFMQIGIGPASAATSPSGATWDLPNYTGETDSSTMSWGNALGHLYNPSTAALNWTWTITSNASNSVTSSAIALNAVSGGSGAIAGTTAVTFGQSGALTGSGALAGTAGVTFTASATATQGAIAGVATASFGQSGTLTAAGALTGTVPITFTASAVPSGNDAAVGSAAITFGQTGALTGSGVLAGTTTVAFGQSGALKGAGALAGASSVAFGASATIGSVGALTGSSAITTGTAATLTGLAATSGTASIDVEAGGTLGGSGVLVGTTAVTFGQSASLAGAGELAGASSITFTVTGNVVEGAIAGTAAIITGASAMASATGALAGVASITTGASVTPQGFAAIAGSSQIIFTTSGAPHGAGALSGIAAITFEASASPARGMIAGTAAIMTGATGTIVGAGTLTGATSITFTASGAAANTGALAGAASLSFSASGTLTGSFPPPYQPPYGYAIIIAEPQERVRCGRSEYLERTTSTIDASFYDETRLPWLPANVRYSLIDVASRIVILPWTGLTPAASLSIDVTSAQNVMVNVTRHRETHEALFQIVDLSGGVRYARALFDVVRVAGLN